MSALKGRSGHGLRPRSELDDLADDLDRMITRRIKIDEINDAMRAMERGEVVRQVIEF